MKENGEQKQNKLIFIPEDELQNKDDVNMWAEYMILAHKHKAFEERDLDGADHYGQELARLHSGTLETASVRAYARDRIFSFIDEHYTNSREKADLQDRTLQLIDNLCPVEQNRID